MQSVVNCVTIIQITSIIVSSEGLDSNTSFLGPSALTVGAFVHVGVEVQSTLTCELRPKVPDSHCLLSFHYTHNGRANMHAVVVPAQKQCRTQAQAAIHPHPHAFCTAVRSINMNIKTLVQQGNKAGKQRYQDLQSGLRLTTAL